MVRQRKRPVPKVKEKLWVREPNGSKTRQVEVVGVDELFFYTLPSLDDSPELAFIANRWHLEDWEPVDDPIPYRLTMTKGNPNAGQHTSSESKAQGKLLEPLTEGRQRCTKHYQSVEKVLQNRKTPQEDIRRWCREGAIREGLIPVEVSL